MLRACAAILLCCTSLAAAEARRFPYQAVVAADNVEVRCGAGTGSAFYVTSLLKRDTQVTVHRHDPGGWYMIAPPEGSFSYVDAQLVRQTASDRGVIHIPPVDGQPPGRAVVRIGSTLSDDCNVANRYLAHGEEVRILGRVTVNADRGEVEMFRILPPPQEFRWVRGDFIVPLDEEHRLASQSDPYQIPADLKPRYIERKIEEKVSRQSLDAPLVTADAALPAPAAESFSEPALPAPAEPDAQQVAYDQLGQLDKQCEAMLQRDPVQWDLAGMEAAYRQLQQSAPEPIPALIVQRLATLEPRKEIATRFQRFVQLTAATDMRDAELVGRQGPTMNITPGAGGEPLTGTIAPFDAASPPGVELGATQSLAAPGLPTPIMAAQPGVGFPVQGSAALAGPGPAMPVTTVSEVQPKLDGAGIIQPTYPPHPGLPPYRLVAPNGRILAYLDPERHVPLQPLVGTPHGIIGRRMHNPRLGVDVIKVQRTMPVVLTP